MSAQQKQRKVREGQAGPATRWDHCASPAAQLVWRGYEWAAGLQKRAVRCDKQSSAEQQSIVDRRKADHNSCVFLSLLAFHRAGESREFFDQSVWGPVAPERLGAVLGQYSRQCNAHVRVYTLTAAGKLQQEMLVGPRGEHNTRCVLVLPSGGETLHCLPLGSLDPEAAIKVPPLVLAELNGAPERRANLPAATQVVAVAPAAPAAPPAPREAPAEKPKVAVAVAAPATPGTGAQAVAVWAPLPQEAAASSTGDLAFGPVGHTTAETVLEAAASLADAAALMVLPPDWEAIPQPAMPKASLEEFSAYGASYRGIQAPPKSLYKADWRGGWFPSQCPARPSLVLQHLKNTFCDVDFASATLDNFEMFGTVPAYLDVRFEGGLTRTGRRTVTDGKECVEFFTAGDVLHVGESVWNVRRESCGLLRVVPACLTASLRSRQPLARFRSGAKVQASVTKLEDETRKKAIWQLVCLTNESATETAILSRMRADEAKNDYKGTDAESSADLVRVLATRYRTAGNVCGPYAWGHCYSCGGELKGKMKQRICCPKRNSDLARLVADGEKVTSHAAPIRYPGVVWTKSRHPPLKKGVQTVATGENFHMPRRDLRLCLPHPSVTAHDSAEWGSTGRSPS